MAKAILLLSGGLDSTLAGKILLDHGVEVEGLNFVSPFCCCTPKGLGCQAARKSGQQLGIPVRVVSCAEDYLEILKRPRFGRGRGMNPCIDCRIYMFSWARKYMEEQGADFVATGEVLGERPMSQRRETMKIIERESGLAGLLVRPLSAGLLPPSLPEREGKVDRKRLFSFKGRRRKPQIDLAEMIGLKEYLCPGGGCLLTDAEFSARFQELLEHEPDFGMEEARLLKIGRHFRLPSGVKMVVGRNEKENKILELAITNKDLLLVPRDLPGPSVLCKGSSTPEDLFLGARLLKSYMKRDGEIELRTSARGIHATAINDARPLDSSLLKAWRICADGVEGAPAKEDIK